MVVAQRRGDHVSAGRHSLAVGALTRRGSQAGPGGAEGAGLASSEGLLTVDHRLVAVRVAPHRLEAFAGDGVDLEAQLLIVGVDDAVRARRVLHLDVELRLVLRVVDVKVGLVGLDGQLEVAELTGVLGGEFLIGRVFLLGGGVEVFARLCLRGLGGLLGGAGIGLGRGCHQGGGQRRGRWFIIARAGAGKRRERPHQ